MDKKLIIRSIIPLAVISTISLVVVGVFYAPVILRESYLNQKLTVPKLNMSLIKKLQGFAAETKKQTEKNKQTVKRPKQKKSASLFDPFSIRVSVKKKETEQPGNKGNAKQGEEISNELMLEGIIESDDIRMAVISGQTLPIGGKINGWYVSEIYKNRVILTNHSNQIKVLRMEGSK